VSLSIAGSAVELTGPPTRREFTHSRIVSIGGDSSSIEFLARDNRQNIARYNYKFVYTIKKKPPPPDDPENGSDSDPPKEDKLPLSYFIFGAIVFILGSLVIWYRRYRKRHSDPEPPGAPPEVIPTNGKPSSKKPLTTLETDIIAGMGKTWAVLIANNAYSDWPHLHGEPYEDVAKVKQALESYLFDKMIEERDLNKNEFELFLENIYQEIVHEDVNSILIYYAGHGEYNQLLDRGYWIPVDAYMQKNRLGYLDDQTVKEYIKVYNRQAKHVLLISDCCFSGSILKFRSGPIPAPTIADIYNLRIDVSKKSATGITSGRKEERVANESLFTKALIDLLIRNREPYLRDEDIAHELSKKVRGVIKQQQPQFGPIADTHDFGKFVFIRNSFNS
jgi:hypothetical protein